MAWAASWAALADSRRLNPCAVTLAKSKALRHHTHCAHHHGQRSGASKEVSTKPQPTKAGCPISKLFANNTEIVLDAKLV